MILFRYLSAIAALLSTLTINPAHADDWPQWLGPKRDGIWRETGIVEAMPAQPTYKWRTKIGAGYAGPAVANGKVYIHDRVLAEDAKNPANSFDRAAVPGKERVHRIDASSGKIDWTHDYDCEYRLSYASGPRCTPLVAGGKVYTLGAMGHLRCLDAASGSLVWQKDFVKDYSAPVQIWGFAAHPLLDGDRLICLVGGDAAVIAFHKDTGKEIWRSMEVGSVGYCPPVIYNIGNTRQLIIWHPESINGLDPETGKVLWSEPFQLHLQSKMSISMPRLAGDKLFVTSFYDGPMLVQLTADPPAARLVWKGSSKSEQPNKTDKLHSIIPTPIIRDGFIYGICSYGQLRCLKLDTGERIWETLKATRAAGMTPADAKPTRDDRWGNAFITPQGNRDWLFNEHGELILAKLSPTGYEELGRMKILTADNNMAYHPVVWSHPAYSMRCCFARNDSEIACVDLAAK
jgi:outer membrane protein assembly factor BamB